jgi:hypothetical protein
VKRVFFAICLLFFVPAVDAGPFGGPPEPGKIPSRFIRFDGIDYGLLFLEPGVASLSLRVTRAECTLGRFRFGVTCFGLHQSHDEVGDTKVTLLAPHVGFSLWSRPRAFWIFYGTAPDIYLEVETSPLTKLIGFDYSSRASLCCSVDYLGVGLVAEGGLISANWRTLAPYLGLHFRLPTLGVGF